MLPIGYLVIRALGTEPSLWWELVFNERVAKLSITTVLLAAVVGLSSAVLGSTIAFLVTRTDLPGRRIIAVAAAVPLAVPSYVAAFNWLTIGLPWGSVKQFEGFWAAALVLTLYSTPYVFLPVAAALAHSDSSQEEVASGLGLTPAQLWWRVRLPQLRPALAGGVLLVVLYVLSDFGAVAILRVDTFTRAIFTAFSAGFSTTRALALSSVLLLLALLILLAEARTRKHAGRLDTSHLARRSLIRLGRWRWPMAAAAALVSVVTLGVPLIGTAHWFISGTSRPESWQRVFEAASGSIGVSLAGALLTVLLALPLGLVAAWMPGRLARWSERAAYLGHSLPGVIVGLSLVYFGIHLARPLYQSNWLLILAYATLFMPLALASIATAAARCPVGLQETAASFGATGWQRFRRITVPLLFPGLAAGATLVFLATMKELPATLMLRPTGLRTLAAELWQATENQRYAEAAPYAALLIGLSVIPMAIVMRRSGILEQQGKI